MAGDADNGFAGKPRAPGMQTMPMPGVGGYQNSGLGRFGQGFVPYRPPAYLPRTYQPQALPPPMMFGGPGAPGGQAQVAPSDAGVGSVDGSGYSHGAQSEGGPAGYISNGFNTGIPGPVAQAAGMATGLPLGLINFGINVLGQQSAGLHGGADGMGMSGPGGIGAVGAPGGLSAAGVGAAGYGAGNVGHSATGPNSIDGGGYDSGGFGGFGMGPGTAGEAAGAAAGAAAAAEGSDGSSGSGGGK